MRNLFKQHNIKFVGTFINVLYLTSPLIGVGMYFVNATTFYAVVFPYLHKFAPWLSFPIFLVFMVLGVLMMMFLFYVLVYAGWQAFQNSQVYKHDNPLKKDLEKSLKQQEKIMRHMGIEDDDE